MSYTDREMRAFTQIAYTDFTDAYNYLKQRTGKDSFSIAELEGAAKALDSNFDSSKLYDLTPDQKMNWKISGIRDTNSHNGFYGCIVETEPGNAALAFRGSENMENPNNLVNDWLTADLGLLNSTQTEQHREVERFLAQYKDKINSYDNVSLTGHSLGGNLAEYATLVSHRYGFDGKVDRCLNLDGPGFSDEFIKLHAADIARMNDRIDHYAMSFVGSMLFPVPGSNYRRINVGKEYDTKDDGSDWDILHRHDTKYIEYDENGNAVDERGGRDYLSVLCSDLSKKWDLLPWTMPFGLGFVIPIFTQVLSFGSVMLDNLSHLIDDIGKGIKSVYKNIKGFFKDMFRGSYHHFRVDTGRLFGDVDEIRQYLNTVKNNVNDMYDSVNAMNGMWTGQANAAFCEKFAREKQTIDAYLQRIEAYVQRLEADARGYDICEHRALDMASSIRV